MSWLTELVGNVIWQVGRKAMAFSRKLSPRELKEDFARWDRPHMPDIDGTCVVCHALDVQLIPKVKCPGSPAQQRARAELARGDDELKP